MIWKIESRNHPIRTAKRKKNKKMRTVYGTSETTSILTFREEIETKKKEKKRKEKISKTMS